ncbi:hypothetical protein Taro_049045 [Colocasia esculenta]|uniref:Uncharacterized protein n=1 Tax=Colocasia esculenta TaxID=4460 RepID=A0A843X9P9_COLES|nr:hypothetical protein [Colocasia esculenta]
MGSGQNATRGCEECDKAVRSGREIATGRSSHSEHEGCAVATRSQNVAYRVVAFIRRNGEEERLGVGDLLLPSRQELLHMTPTRCKLAPKGLVESSFQLGLLAWYSSVYDVRDSRIAGKPRPSSSTCSDTTKLSCPENYAADINNAEYNSRRYPEM